MQPDESIDSTFDETPNPTDLRTLALAVELAVTELKCRMRFESRLTHQHRRSEQEAADRVTEAMDLLREHLVRQLAATP